MFFFIMSWLTVKMRPTNKLLMDRKSVNCSGAIYGTLFCVHEECNNVLSMEERERERLPHHTALRW